MSIGLDRRRGGRPLYWQIAALLEERIERGGLRPGDLLPSENELVAELKVSRTTVAKALESLASRGVVAREQGRGTFVSNPPMERRLPELTGFSEHIRGLGLQPSQRLLSYTRVRAHGDDPVLGAYPAGLELVVARRLRLVDGHHAGLHRTAVPAEVADAIGFTEQALASPDASLYALMEAGGVVLTEAHESLRAINASQEDADLLGIGAGAALIEVTRHSHDGLGRLVEVVQARYLGSMYVYRIDLARPSAGPPNPRRHHDETSQGTRYPARSVGLAAARGMRVQ